ncbi:putative surface protease GP63, putative,metallopeptidase [Trypanosoma grayi]|uniref:putative surface protease GP63, putative,metallopeptidase n=1 Tax=Trypanosoma grayi TaxID=71804 RepID=UPI0004F41CE3|nr:putative surface protease GP63, putative,metallopeptidase [Trypanosoma grayi]KEG09233.1 putative surface protease GP63, putative,metallopeptidase [Trypanosoma grayi]
MRQRCPGSVVGPRSRCLHGTGVTFKEQLEGDDAALIEVGDVCVEVRCRPGDVVLVRYMGEAKWRKCAEGQQLNLAHAAHFTGDHLTCPRYDEVCSCVPQESGDGELEIVTDPEEAHTAATNTAAAARTPNPKTADAASPAVGDEKTEPSTLTDPAPDSGDTRNDGSGSPAWMGVPLLLLLAVAASACIFVP